MNNMEYATTIYFVRHGHVRNPAEVFYGRLLGFPLSEQGRHQASLAKEILRDKPIAAAYSSPQLRARETTQIIVEPHENLIINASELINEVYSPFDACPVHEVEERNWDVYSGVDSGFEQPVDVLRRARQFISQVSLGHMGQQIIAVTHGDTLAFIVLWAKGIPYSPEHKQQLYKEILYPGSVIACTIRGKDDETPKIEYMSPLKEDHKVNGE